MYTGALFYLKKAVAYGWGTTPIGYRPFQMRAWSCVTSYYSPLRRSHCHTLDTVNPAMGMMLCSSMLAFEKVYTIGGLHLVDMHFPDLFRSAQVHFICIYGTSIFSNTKIMLKLCSLCFRIFLASNPNINIMSLTIHDNSGHVIMFVIQDDNCAGFIHVPL